MEDLHNDLAELEQRYSKKQVEMEDEHHLKVENIKAESLSALKLAQEKHSAQQKKWRNHATQLEKQLVTEKDRLEALHQLEVERMRAESSNALDAMQQKLTTEQAQLQARISRLEQEHANKQEEARQALEKKKLEHAALLAEIQRTHRAQQEERAKGFQNKLDVLEARIAQMINTHASEKKALQKECEDRKSQLDIEADKERARMEAEHKTKRAQLDAIHTRLQAEFKEREKRLEHQHADERERLRQEVGKYSAALLVRDDFAQKTMPDSDIKARFLEVADDVDALARLDWKSTQTIWSTHMFKNRSPADERMLKKHILKDGIWKILHKFIFCSPFRILGDEGLSLEGQWNEQCGISQGF